MDVLYRDTQAHDKCRGLAESGIDGGKRDTQQMPRYWEATGHVTTEPSTAFQTAEGSVSRIRTAETALPSARAGGSASRPVQLPQPISMGQLRDIGQPPRVALVSKILQKRPCCRLFICYILHPGSLGACVL